MRRSVLALSAVSLVLSAAPLTAETIEVAPSGPWNVDFGEERCRLTRTFGQGDDQHLLLIEQYWPGRSFGLTAAGAAFSKFRNQQATTVAFSDAQTPQSLQSWTGDIQDFGPAVIFSRLFLTPRPDGSAQAETPPSGVPTSDMTAARSVQFVSLKQGKAEVRLMTGPLDQAFGVLDNCALDLIGTWGLDIEQHRTATRMARLIDRDAVVRKVVAAYPRDAANIGEQGLVRMRVTVTPEGTVSDCAVIKATETQRLESPACKVMQTARFEPALDAAGAPMRSYYTENITYQMRR